MDQINSIFNRIKKNEKKYGEKTLIGLMDVQSDEFAAIEKNAKEIMLNYRFHPCIYRKQSEILSVYAVLFYVYRFEGDKFWESLGYHLGLEEKYVRDLIIEAMKNAYDTHDWNFYQTTRNEYVETIKMHGVIGNDSSGDKIIYALYLIYLKDFEREVTNEKLDFFFPYLRELFKKEENKTDETMLGYELNSITYIRNQFPQSFMHAYLLNPSAVATELKNIFYFFEYYEFGESKPFKIKKRFENKIKTSLERNDNFVNEYTKVYVNKKKIKKLHKKKIEYGKTATQLHIPMHFIDFQYNENRNIILKVYDNQELLKSMKLPITEGGIGWKSKPIDLSLPVEYTNIRYTVEKEKTKEVIYDSGKALHKNKENEIIPAEDKKKKNLARSEAKIFHIDEKGEKNEASFQELKTGQVYEVFPADKFDIIGGDFKEKENRLFTAVSGQTEIKNGQKIYKAEKNEPVLAFYNKYLVSGANIKINQRLYHIFQNGVKFEVLMRYPYSLNELQVKLNNICYDGLTIRKRFLKKVDILVNGDFRYVIEITEGLKARSMNNLEVFIKIRDLKLSCGKKQFYCDPNWSLASSWTEFGNEKYIKIEGNSNLERNKEIKRIKEDKISLFLKGHQEDLEAILTIDRPSERKEPLSVLEFEKAVLYHPNKNSIVSKVKKKAITYPIYESWQKKVKSFLIDLLETTDLSNLLNTFLEDYTGFRQTLSECLEEVEDFFLDNLFTALREALLGKVNAKNGQEKYVAELIEILADYETDTITKEPIAKAVKLYENWIEDEKAYEDINHSVCYDIEHSESGNENISELLLNEIIPEHQELSMILYKLSSKIELDEIGTIKKVRNVQLKYPEKDAMTYYELVISFRKFIFEKQLSRNTVDSKLFMSMFYQFAAEYNQQTVCEWMNALELCMEQQIHTEEKRIIRKKLLILAEKMDLRKSINRPALSTLKSL